LNAAPYHAIFYYLATHRNAGPAFDAKVCGDRFLFQFGTHGELPKVL
jgi:hypothetical protein